LAGDSNLESSYYINRSKALEAFPMLRKNDLVGALVYYDGQSNDARVNVSLALTAIQKGATVTNYTEVVELLKNEQGKLNGAMVKDNCTGETFKVTAKGIINATGPFCDKIRQMDDPSLPTVVAPSTGAHIIFPGFYSPRDMGLVDPSTSDGRVIFFLPWEGNTIAGTTDTPSEVESNPKATKDDINFIVNEVTNYLDPVIKVRKSDVLAAWSGIRPLIRNPASTNTEELVRNHIVMVSQSNLVTIAGGKWTTYRQMAEETVNEAIKIFGKPFFVENFD
jgi:glycerol-3-phosphate dehydrogenase